MQTDNKHNYNWTVLDSEQLHNEPWLSVRRERVQLPNGNIVPSYYILDYPDWVNVIAITKEQKFVFVKQYRHGIQRVNYELCAGVCEAEDQSPLISAKRELWEETGFGNGEWEEFLCIAPNASSNSNFTHCFIARDVEQIDHPHLEDSEDLTVHLFSFEEVKQMVENGEIVQATMAAPLWKYLAKFDR